MFDEPLLLVRTHFLKLAERNSQPRVHFQPKSEL